MDSIGRLCGYLGRTKTQLGVIQAEALDVRARSAESVPIKKYVAKCFDQGAYTVPAHAHANIRVSEHIRADVLAT